jgi:hypothetical protein
MSHKGPVLMYREFAPHVTSGWQTASQFVTTHKPWRWQPGTGAKWCPVRTSGLRPIFCLCRVLDSVPGYLRARLLKAVQQLLQDAAAEAAGCVPEDEPKTLRSSLMHRLGEWSMSVQVWLVWIAHDKGL